MGNSCPVLLRSTGMVFHIIHSVGSSNPGTPVLLSKCYVNCVGISNHLLHSVGSSNLELCPYGPLPPAMGTLVPYWLLLKVCWIFQPSLFSCVNSGTLSMGTSSTSLGNSCPIISSYLKYVGSSNHLHYVRSSNSETAPADSCCLFRELLSRNQTST